MPTRPMLSKRYFLPYLWAKYQSAMTAAAMNAVKTKNFVPTRAAPISSAVFWQLSECAKMT